jgi:hypothetical protein
MTASRLRECWIPPGHLLDLRETLRELSDQALLRELSDQALEPA